MSSIGVDFFNFLQYRHYKISTIFSNVNYKRIENFNLAVQKKIIIPFEARISLVNFKSFLVINRKKSQRAYYTSNISVCGIRWVPVLLPLPYQPPSLLLLRIYFLCFLLLRSSEESDARMHRKKQT